MTIIPHSKQGFVIKIKFLTSCTQKIPWAIVSSLLSQWICLRRKSSIASSITSWRICFDIQKTCRLQWFSNEKRYLWWDRKKWTIEKRIDGLTLTTLFFLAEILCPPNSTLVHRHLEESTAKRKMETDINQRKRTGYLASLFNWLINMLPSIWN